MAKFGITRRRFLHVAGGLTAASAGAAGLYFGTQTAIPRGAIGAGGRGLALAAALKRNVFRTYGDVRAICDVDRSRAEGMKHAFFRRADVYQDYRRLLERDDLRGVVVATPDHWHAKIA